MEYPQNAIIVLIIKYEFIKNICPLMKITYIAGVEIQLCRSGGTGRHAVFRAQCPYGRGGSTPPFGIYFLSKIKLLISFVYDLYSYIIFTMGCREIFHLSGFYCL